jgi:hypothetical protein
MSRPTLATAYESVYASKVPFRRVNSEKGAHSAPFPDHLATTAQTCGLATLASTSSKLNDAGF